MLAFGGLGFCFQGLDMFGSIPEPPKYVEEWAFGLYLEVSG